MLKIVSGAMKPTAGSVEVDRSKVQLLTLGTGFDMELTGKKNVYLNGAIIGYSKQFLDSHYDEIVEFAELKDFMDEKFQMRLDRKRASDDGRRSKGSLCRVS